LLKFHEIVLRKFITTFAILFLIIGAIVYYWSKDFYIAQARNSLVQNIEIISFELYDDGNLDELAIRIKNSLDLRLTIISNDGRVIAESHEDKRTMDNHKQRDEILQADEKNFGEKIRHSTTVETDLLYIAKKYTINGKTVYIRIAKELKSINKEISALGVKVFLALVIFFILVFLLAYNISKNVEKETLKIVNFLKSLAKKKKPTYVGSNFSQEFSDITNLLSKVSQILIKKEKQKSKYTDKLQLSNQQKDDIISAISHEFKNPIAVINGYAQTLLDDENLDKNMQNKFLQKIYNNGIKLTDLIDTLRLSTKLESGQQRAKFSDINLYNLINDNVENLQLNYPQRVIKIDGDTKLKIKADPSLFGVVITNLIENALKYSQDEILISFNTNSLHVKDRGIGISKKDLQNITDKFYRVNANSWNNSLGLGLSIVSSIVSLHNFTLHVESKEYEGSTFSIRF